MTPKWKGEPAKVLDFDIECRPLSWYGGDFVTKEVTAIAASFIGTGEVHCYLLRKEHKDGSWILNAFLELYNEADMVTGHFIRGFDLPVINGALMEYGFGSLGAKLTQDTKLDLLKKSGLSSSQENLGAMLGLEAPKVGMDQAKWRSANRLEDAGVELTKERVIGDVIQHMEMREQLLKQGWLSSPKMWHPEPGRTTKYHG